MRSSSRTLPLVAAIAVPLVATAVLVPFRESVSSANLALVLVVAVVGVAATGNRVAAIVGAVVTALAYDIFLTQPYGSPAIAEPSELLTAVLLLVVGVAVGAISSWARRQREVAVERTDDLGLVYHVIDQIAGGASSEELVALGEREIRALLDARTVRFERDAMPAHAAPGAEPGDDLPVATIDRVGDVRVGDLQWPVNEVGLPHGPLLLPVQSGGLPLGAYVIEPRATEPIETWRVVLSVMVADLIASALARWPSDA
jgi:K+-sensing histidine kinase KdpD